MGKGIVEKSAIPYFIIFWACLWFALMGLLGGYYLGWSDRSFFQTKENAMMEESGACDWAKSYVKDRCTK